MREIVLDVETTGRVAGTDRLIEVCAIEIEGNRETGRVYHKLYNPERPVEEGATRVHGWTWEKLKGYPPFAREARGLADFLGDAPIVAHNGKFDMDFLKAEFAAARVRAQLGQLVDTLQIARGMWPGQKNDLDSVCRRLDIDLSERKLHGALVDVRLLMQAYVRMLGRDQLIPVAAPDTGPAVAAAAVAVAVSPFAGRTPRPASPPTEAEAERHAAFVSGLGAAAIWLRGAAGGAAGAV